MKQNARGLRPLVRLAAIMLCALLPALAGHARGATLYAAQCAGCHGAQGRGDGPAGNGLDPAPSDFHDAERMAGRGVYGLYNTIARRRRHGHRAKGVKKSRPAASAARDSAESVSREAPGA